ncbi:hypothetical protein Tcan_00764, partial [Toxocara canis]
MPSFIRSIFVVFMVLFVRKINAELSTSKVCVNSDLITGYGNFEYDILNGKMMSCKIRQRSDAVVRGFNTMLSELFFCFFIAVMTIIEFLRSIEWLFNRKFA